MLKIVAISDTHGMLNRVIIPDGDVLIHAGDLSGSGTLVDMVKELNLLKKLPHKHKILIAGNHDYLAERNPGLMKTLCTDAGITYLQDSAIEINGLKIYGSPWQPEFNNWAFNVPRGYLHKYWDLIPDDTNILITHGPPKGIRDYAPACGSVGCEELLSRVTALKNLKLHVFGHIHHSHGTSTLNEVTFINASTCTESYKPSNVPITIELSQSVPIVIS
jgi:Icc-related predicted phosphoesterase